MNTEKNIKTLIVKKPLKLDCGKTIKDFPIAYETYGSLNSKKDNAILVFHALTGDLLLEHEKLILLSLIHI